MSSRPNRHRWMLALPVVLTVVALTLREGVDRERDLAAARGPWVAGEFLADSGADFALHDDAIDLRAGGILAYAPGIATVRANGWDVSVWGGAAYVAVSRAGATVAALDVPVVVRGPLGTAVVPPAAQWRTPSRALPDPLEDPLAWRDAVVLDPLPERFVREKKDVVSAWKAMIEPSQLDVSASLLGRGTSEEVARIALAAPPSRTIAAAVRSRGDLRFYGMLQPAVRDAAWAYVPDGARIDAATWMSLLLLPRLPSDESSSLTARKWGEMLAAAIAASPDRDGLRSSLLPAIEADVMRIADRGYPLRALQFAAAARAAFSSGAILTDAANAALGRLEALSPETLRASVLSDIGRLPPVTEVAPVMLPEPLAIVSDSVLEARAKDLLAAKGAMFIADTTIRTSGEGTVDVDRVAFGFPSGDRTLHFRYAPATDTVQAFIDGELQPYAVPWQGYIDWESTR